MVDGDELVAEGSTSRREATRRRLGTAGSIRARPVVAQLRRGDRRDDEDGGADGESGKGSGGSRFIARARARVLGGLGVRAVDVTAGTRGGRCGVEGTDVEAGVRVRLCPPWAAAAAAWESWARERVAGLGLGGAQGAGPCKPCV